MKQLAIQTAVSILIGLLPEKVRASEAEVEGYAGSAIVGLLNSIEIDKTREGINSAVRTTLKNISENLYPAELMEGVEIDQVEFDKIADGLTEELLKEDTVLKSEQIESSDNKQVNPDVNKEKNPVVLVDTEPTFNGTPTFGEAYVGVKFNPSGLGEVGHVKNKFANVIDQLHNLRRSSTSAMKNELCGDAIKAAGIAQMLAVKAITWED